MFDFIIPNITVAEMSEDKRHGRFVVEPLECFPRCPEVR